MTLFQPRPLTARQDPLNHSEVESQPRKCHWRLPARFGPELKLGLPIYSRLSHCNSMSRTCLDELLVRAIGNSCDEFEVPWVGSVAEVSSASHASWRVHSIGIDEPVDSVVLQSVAAIQLQLFGISNSGAHPSQHSAWTPSLPIELSSYEHLASKLDGIRGCLAEGKPIGAAVIPSADTIYEDVRFLIDAGFDWIEIVQSPHYALRAGACLDFAEIQIAATKALKAKQDSRTTCCPLWLTASTNAPADIVRFLDQGFEGVCIDSYLASRAPVQVAVRDMLAGIRVQSMGHGQTDYSWLKGALGDLGAYLQDVIAFRTR